MTASDIFNNAIHNLEKDVPITWDWKAITPHRNVDIDGELEMAFNNKKVVFHVEIKRDVKNHQIHNILYHNNKFQNFLLVAEKLFPKVKEELREHNVNYLEGNGNAYIDHNDIFLYVDTHKTPKTKKDKGNRAFTKTGLKVVFQFLLQPQLINKTQREIAEVTRVALGNIPLIINGLLDTNFILKLNKNEYVINNYEELLHRWVTEFERTLRPAIFKQRFRFKDKNQDWKEIRFDTKKSVWGGEPAGDILTNHLRPEKYIFYTVETLRDLMTNYRLIPDNEGDVWAYDLFWPPEFNDNAAPAVLVYTELLLGNDKRSRETANIIFNEHIQPNL